MIEMPRSLDESENWIGRLTFKYKPEEIPSYELEYISWVLYEIYDKKSLVVSSCMIYNKSNQLLESSINDSAYNGRYTFWFILFISLYIFYLRK